MLHWSASSRRVPIKRHEDFLTAASAVASELPNFRFLVVGRTSGLPAALLREKLRGAREANSDRATRSFLDS
jgi:hypothetical protein